MTRLGACKIQIVPEQAVWVPEDAELIGVMNSEDSYSSVLTFTHSDTITYSKSRILVCMWPNMASSHHDKLRCVGSVKWNDTTVFVFEKLK